MKRRYQETGETQIEKEVTPFKERSRENTVISPSSSPNTPIDNDRDHDDKKVIIKKQRSNRTVNDFGSSEELLNALLSSSESGSFASPVEAGCALVSGMKDGATNLDELRDTIRHKATNEQFKADQVDRALDWVLENYDADSTRQQSFQDELHRLLVLKSFFALDIERQEAFDRVTDKAQEQFGCPINLISLVDLGRQRFLSNKGLEGVTETPRKVAFCAHAIQSTKACFVVPDATQDERFANNPLVTGPPDIRFYAGAPLITREGYKIGTLCIIDKVPRPDGLSEEDQESLKKLAAEAMLALETHRITKTNWFQNLKKTCRPNLRLQEDDTGRHEEGSTPMNRKSTTTHKNPQHQKKRDKDSPREKNDLQSLLDQVGGLSLSGLLAILHGQNGNLKLPGMEEYLEKCAGLANRQLSSRVGALKSAMSVQASSTATGKRVTFLPEIVHSIDSWKEMKDLWWNAIEMYEFRRIAALEVDDYRRHESHYIMCIEALADEDDLEEIADCLVQLIKPPYSQVRGLEYHIVDNLSAPRRKITRLLLAKQESLKLEDPDTKTMSIRKECEKASSQSQRFVQRMAKCDEYMAANSYTNA